MQILEHGQAQERTLLFFPCTAEPVWAFADTIAQLSQRWHVFQVVYDGQQPEYPGDFTSVEQTVDEVISYLKSHGVSRLGGAYGCSMGGACLTRMLALGEMPIDRAIIEATDVPCIIAGGLDASNVAEAIYATHPYGVDSFSLTNYDDDRADTDRCKDPAKVEAFIKAAKDA